MPLLPHMHALHTIDVPTHFFLTDMLVICGVKGHGMRRALVTNREDPNVTHPPPSTLARLNIATTNTGIMSAHGCQITYFKVRDW